MSLISMVSPGALVFLALAGITIISALGVALSKNILHSGFALLGTLGGVAGLYLFIGADFLGVAQLIIYVGGILVLILFAVLLTNKIKDVNISNLQASLLQGGIAAVALIAVLIQVVTGTAWHRPTIMVGTTPTPVETFTPTTARLGDAFLREYLLPFELASIVLLMALVGAMVIARRAARDEAPKGDVDDRLD